MIKVTAFKPILGFPQYSISKCGSVKSSKSGKIMSKTLNNMGYVMYRLYDGSNKSKSFLAHRLVAMTYLEDSKLHVLHNDGDKTNNCVHNLRYGTQKENMEDKVKHGTQSRATPKRKLTDEQIRAIRVDKGSYAELGRKYTINPSSIRAIKLGTAFRGLE